MADLTLNDFSDLEKEELRDKLLEELNSILPDTCLHKTETVTVNSEVRHIPAFRWLNVIINPILELYRYFFSSNGFLLRKS